MLVTFRSAATADIFMLRDLAQYLLGLAGKSMDARGAILSDDLPDAIERLEQAIRDDVAHENAHEHSTLALPLGLHAQSSVAQRAWPLLEMMREASKQGAHVMWGV